MTTHKLKTWPPYFQAVVDGTKTFELRYDDRGFAVGDVVELHEYDPDRKSRYTRVCRRTISYIVPGGQFGLEPGFVCLGLDENEPESGGRVGLAAARESARALVQKVKAAERRIAEARAASGSGERVSVSRPRLKVLRPRGWRVRGPVGAFYLCMYCGHRWKVSEGDVCIACKRQVVYLSAPPTAPPSDPPNGVWLSSEQAAALAAWGRAWDAGPEFASALGVAREIADRDLGSTPSREPPSGPYPSTDDLRAWYPYAPMCSGWGEEHFWVRKGVDWARAQVPEPEADPWGRDIKPDKGAPECSEGKSQ